MIDRTGQPFRSYRLVRPLGRGRFSQVYLAEHLETRQPAALKLVAAQLSPAEEARFLDEGRRLLAIEHAHILGVREVGLEGGSPFLVLDYAPRGNLALARGKLLPPEQVAAYVRQSADALTHAHQLGVLHQNIKPSNLLLAAPEHVLLGDWGLETVQAHLEANRRDEQPEDIAYLAPEQLRGPARPASDQYALALVAYEWLTGGPPFTGTYFSVYEQQCYAAPPLLRGRVPGISAAVEAVVLLALSKDPEQRFASVLEFATLLERAVYTPERFVSATRRRRPATGTLPGRASDFAPEPEASGPGDSLLRRLRAPWRRQE